MSVMITFSNGSLIIKGEKNLLEQLEDYAEFDQRIGCYRAEAYRYSDIILTLRALKIEHVDNASAFSKLDVKITFQHQPRQHQKDALKAWISSKYRGVISMPTGSGKTYFAMLAMAYIKRTTMIVVPTIDLLHQWASLLERNFATKIGMLGGGSKEHGEITVATYDSAQLHMEYCGNRYGLIIFDECHHLPSPGYRLAASMSIAPYRIGLTATPDDDLERKKITDELIGPIVYQLHIDRLKGNILANYKINRIYLHLTDEEQIRYDTNRSKYLSFVRSCGIDFNKENSWREFIYKCAVSNEGKEAFTSYMEQKAIARNAIAKIKTLWELIKKHKNEQMIIFTADNNTAYKIGETFFLPVITHSTKAIERKNFLDKFRNGKYPIIVTSKVLNEGVDVPNASIGVVISGSASIREHVQRLGRILRAKDNKGKAILYELITYNTSEMNVSERRGQHRAYIMT